MVSYLRISNTRVTTKRLIHYENTNFLGRLHGGDMLNFLVDTGMISAMKVARGLAVIASIDDVVFKKPIMLGDIIDIEAEVDYVGNTSMEVSMRAIKGDEVLVEAFATYVKVDEFLRPTIVENKVYAESNEELERYNKALKRRQERAENIKDRIRKRYDTSDPTYGLRYRTESTYFVTPDMTYDGRIISAGKLLKLMDDIGGALCLNYISEEGAVVTVSINSTSFYTPIRLSDIIKIRAGISYIGSTSFEVILNVIRLDPRNFVEEHVTTAYFNYVRIDKSGRPTKVKEYTPITEREKQVYQEAIERRKKFLKS
ncbi:acyl-CoA thioesterase [Sulfurisphaera ohwakuensis]|uniref:Acyl-CoA thioesterase n=1 Tax=Sulfurisphaera ohwakuensis TaxID=69656 RepID=A0A650CJ80_SULOH|nr:acyl-CoA thioesterase [Sulfurisphaera ohwakuensis]